MKRKNKSKPLIRKRDGEQIKGLIHKICNERSVKNALLAVLDKSLETGKPACLVMPWEEGVKDFVRSICYFVHDHHSKLIPPRKYPNIYIRSAISEGRGYVCISQTVLDFLEVDDLQYIEMSMQDINEIAKK